MTFSGQTRNDVVRRLADAARDGGIGKFDPKTESVSCYEERLLLHLTANNIADEHADRRKSIFLSEVGRDIYQILSDLCSPDKAASKTLDQLLKKLKDHFEPVPNEIITQVLLATSLELD